MKKIEVTGPPTSNLRILIVDGGEDRYFVCLGDKEADKKAQEMAKENRGTRLSCGKCVHILKPSRLWVDEGDYKDPMKIEKEE